MVNTPTKTVIPITRNRVTKSQPKSEHTSHRPENGENRNTPDERRNLRTQKLARPQKRGGGHDSLYHTIHSHVQLSLLQMDVEFSLPHPLQNNPQLPRKCVEEAVSLAVQVLHPANQSVLGEPFLNDLCLTGL
jgi:hypothetical protein